MPRNAKIQAKRKQSINAQLGRRVKAKGDKKKTTKPKANRRRPRRSQGGASAITVTATARTHPRLIAAFKRAVLLNNMLVLPGQIVSSKCRGPTRARVQLHVHIARARAKLNPKHPSYKDQLATLAYLESTGARQATPVTLTDADAVAKGTGLSDCAAVFGKAMSNPFGTYDMLPCVPCSPPAMSQRTYGLMRGTFSTGSGHCGWCLVAPFIADNVMTKVLATKPTYAGTTATLFATGATVSALVEPDFPYTFNQLTTGMEVRTVACGIRWRNITEAGKVGGMSAAYQGPDITNYTDYSPDNVLADRSSVVASNAVVPLKVGEEQNTWTTMVWRPRDEGSLDAEDSIDNPYNPNFTVFIVATDGGDPQTFEFEVITFVEYSGVSVDAGTGAITYPAAQTMSDVDEVGMDRVLEGLQRTPLDLQAGAWAEQAVAGIVDSVAHSDTAARTSELIEGSGGMGLGKILGMANSLLSFFMA